MAFSMKKALAQPEYFPGNCELAHDRVPFEKGCISILRQVLVRRGHWFFEGCAESPAGAPEASWFAGADSC
jgi:hypothetical protein